MKNKIIMCGQTIKKFFNSHDAFENEMRVLRALNGKFAPAIVETGENYIEMNKITGTELIDYLTVENGDPYIAGQLLGGFLVCFHASFPEITLSDVNFHNFIVNSDGLFAIDFEELESGALKDAVTKGIAFARRDLPRENADKFTRGLCGKTGISLTQIEQDIEIYRCFLVKRKIAKRSGNHVDQD